jgi:uncharacterized RDD family membrane protein YckC
MDIWIIRDGEKVGPLHDYEVRRKIEDGELPASTPAWHEGLSSWKPLVEIELFTREFQLAEKSAAMPIVENEPPPPLSRVTPPPLPQETYYVRRFWARWFDLSLYSGLWWLSMWAVGQDIEGLLLSGWMMILVYVPWFGMEAYLLHRFGTTPGKWLLGIKVVNKDGTLMSLSASMIRALRVMFTGVGFGWGLLAIFCQALSLITARRLGTTFWDHVGGHQAQVTSLHPLRVIALIFVFAGALQLQMAVISPYLFEYAAKDYPAFKKMYDENPPWHLPKRS